MTRYMVHLTKHRSEVIEADSPEEAKKTGRKMLAAEEAAASAAAAPAADDAGGGTEGTGDGGEGSGTGEGTGNEGNDGGSAAPFDYDVAGNSIADVKAWVEEDDTGERARYALESEQASAAEAEAAGEQYRSGLVDHLAPVVAALDAIEL